MELGTSPSWVVMHWVFKQDWKHNWPELLPPAMPPWPASPWEADLVSTLWQHTKLSPHPSSQDPKAWLSSNCTNTSEEEKMPVSGKTQGWGRGVETGDKTAKELRQYKTLSISRPTTFPVCQISALPTSFLSDPKKDENTYSHIPPGFVATGNPARLPSRLL